MFRAAREQFIARTEIAARAHAVGSSEAGATTSRVGRRRILRFVPAVVTTFVGSVLTRSWPFNAAQAIAAGSQGTAGEPHITIDLPLVYEDGNSVPLAVAADSPMRESDYVRELRIVAPGNPLTEVARLHFTPQSGRAEVSTRIRLDAGMQSVEVTATFSDGSVRSATARTQIAVGGCSTS